MTIKVWDGSAWQMGSQIKIWDGTAWQNGTNANVHIWTGSAWQKVHPGVYMEPNYAADIADPGVSAEDRITLFANGTLQVIKTGAVSGTTMLYNHAWLLTGTNSDYDAYVTDFTGDPLNALSSPYDGTRLQLNSNYQWLLRTTGPFKTANFNLNICSHDGTGTQIQTAFIDFTVEAGFV